MADKFPLSKNLTLWILPFIIPKFIDNITKLTIPEMCESAHFENIDQYGYWYQYIDYSGEI